MNLFDSIVLGIVEGLTEFLPVSSTGHMILTSHFLGLHGKVVDAFEVFIQLGAILAVVVLYHHRFHRLFDFRNETSGLAGKRGWLLLALTSLPILALGFVTKKYIEAHLFNATTVAWALGIGGLLLIAIEQFKFPKNTLDLDEITPRQALTIGLCQCVALWPGASRAAFTIIGGRAAGLNRQTATEYSFLAAVPVMTIVTVYSLLKIIKLLTPADFLNYGVGFVVAFLAAIVAVRGFIALVQRINFVPFGIYRILVAGLYLWIVH